MKLILYLVAVSGMAINIFAAQPIPDTPMSFGYKMAWYAVKTTNSQAVADALNLKSQRLANWKDGYKEAYSGNDAFVSPPIFGWVFVVGTPLFPDLKPTAEEKSLTRLKELSRQFGEAQLFATHRGVSSHAWAKAVGGNLVRAFGYNGDEGRDMWGVGQPTKEEVDLGLKYAAGKEPDEEDVMKLAGHWSVNPQNNDKVQVPPALGVIGKL